MQKILLSFLIIFAFQSNIFALQKVTTITQALQDELNAFPKQPLLHIKIDNGDCFSSDPNNYVLVKNESSLAFLAGNLDEAALIQVKDFLALSDSVVLLCNERYHDWFLKNGYALRPRVEMVYEAKKLPEALLPEKLTIKNIDADLLTRCQWYKWGPKHYGSLEAFLSKGLGVALCNEKNLVVCEVYALGAKDGFCELGIITRSDYRRKGLAFVTAAHLIKQCLECNLIPVWSCECENQASFKTAQKLGFQVKRYYSALKKI